MSAVIKTATHFVIEDVLITALKEIGAEPTLITQLNIGIHDHRDELKVGDILTNRSDYYGQQHFRLIDDRWVLRHDSSEMNGRITTLSAVHKSYKKVGAFLQAVSKAYENAYQEHLTMLAEQERIRLEEERKQRIETIRQQAIAKAKAQGYSVKESQNGGQIQLVLTRTV
ncbi:hypothetical protein K6U56_12170 [Vibrio furnissii]|uniref:hypothetical protein n=1 Tax=Vibrio furnissii TaxID=29494 RepID=UPI0013028048|nr:hypothetical protein [Vibrio furnissii]MCG6212721.1 hypothetical protein [Vibrio furnissii]